MSADDRKEILRLINEWNSSRYELFAISQPNERLEFHGVMRFYFQDAGEKVSTKCIRVDSTASTEDVIKVLIEKFRPDMKLLPSSKDFAVYEIHTDTPERKLDPNERPLWVQLEWGKDGREGRFLLKNENAKTVQFDAQEHSLLTRDKKRMSKRDKKKQQKMLKEAATTSSSTASGKENTIQPGTSNVAENLYKEVPDSNFTRSISNPEIVMQRRRAQKLQNKLKQIVNKDGGGTLKVYGETLKPDIPYKTLLLSNNDTAAFAVKETLEKYGLSTEDPENYCLVQVVTPSREEREKYSAQIKEYILEDSACPLAILLRHPSSSGGQVIFQIRRCTPDILAARKQKKKAEMEKQHRIQQQQQQQHQNFNMPNEALMKTENENVSKLPCLIELTYEGFDLPSPRIIQIKSDFYEIGNDKSLAISHPINYILLDPSLPGIERKHCAIKKSPDNVQILLIPYAETYVNDHLIKEPVHLINNFTIRLGQFCMFRVENPNQMDHMTMNSQQQAMPQQQQLNNKPSFSNMMSNGNTPTNAASKPPQIPPNYGVLYETGQVSEPVPQTRTPQVPSTPTNPQQSINRDGLPMQSSSSGLAQPQQNGNTAVQGSAGPKSTEPGLPGLLEFRDEDEDELLSHLCSANPNQVQFKLAPVYIMYMMLRFRLSQKYKNELTFNEKLHTVLPVLVHKMVNYIREAVDVNHSDRHVLPFWLANSSELLYFLKQDVHLSQISYDAQEALADCVQITFKYLVNIMQHQLDQVLGVFFDPSDAVEDLDESGNQVNGFDELQSKTSLKQVIQVLNETMSLLRGCRVNAALTIQLFSQLFHYVSMWLFNRLVSRNNIASNGISFCSRYWGEKLTRRLSGIRSWAERQGLEIAADCHLLRIIQSAAFLHAPKHDAQELSIISSNCYSLNSIQIRHLLKNYVQATNEPPLNGQLCQNLISIAQKTADEVIKQEGRILQLEEECDLQLPFLLPDDGHSCESIKGLPKGLLDFLEGFQNMNLCWLWQNTQGPGSWKKYLIKPQPSIDNNGSLNNSNQLQSIQPSTPIANQQPNMMMMQQNQPHQQAATPVSTPTTQPINNIGASTPTNGPSNNFPSSSNMASTSSLNQKPLMSSTGALEQVDSVKPPMMNPLPLPQVVKIKLFKKNNSLGLSIVAAIGLNKATGIYVKSVVPGGAAADDGRIDAGDQLLAVDEFSLINVSQERAAELMTKSGPGSVMLPVAKEAAAFNGLDAILSKSPIPQPTQQMLTASMPALNNGHNSHMSQGSIGFTQAYQNNMPTNFTAATLPRNHQIHNQQAQQQYHNNQQQQNLPPATKPGPAVAPRPISNGHQFVNNNINSQSVSKTNGVVSPVHHPYTRQLPNEAQVRYGSERPVSMHQLQIQQQQQQQQQQQSQQQTIRNLPNDAMPRFGSERPAMTNHPMSMTPLNTMPFSQQPIPKRFNDPVRQASQSQIQRPQQISLNEMDEIDYNNKMMNGNYRNQIPPMQQSQQQQQQQQAIMSYLNNGNQGANGGLAKQQRTKSVGQLYEHIWNQNNANDGKTSPTGMNNGQQTVMPAQISHHNYKSTYSVEDLNMRQLDLNQTTPKLPINGNGFNYNNVPNPIGNSLNRISRPNIQQQPPPLVGQHSAMRNYENQVVNKPTVPPPAPALVSKLNMINGASGMSKTSLNPPSMFNSASKLVDYANGPTNGTTGGGNTSPDQSSKMIKHWEREQWMRQQEEEEYRLNLLRQRMDMLKELESKQYRTAEDENRLNKLRTEIEFDKRVLEMNYNSNTNQSELTTQMSNGSSGNGVEFEDEYDMQRAHPNVVENNLNTSSNNYVQSNEMCGGGGGGFSQAELRDRLVSQMRQEIHSPQHRNKFDEMIKYDGQMAYNKTNLNGKNDTDRLIEARREENRLRKHMEMTNQTSPEHQQSVQNGMVSNMIVSRPQKHVQFMAEPTEMSAHNQQPQMALPNTSPKFNKTPPSSSSSSSDQLDSSPSTPPPPPPPIQTQPTAKRVMFSCDTSKLLEFERQQQPLNGAHDDILPNTPCVIGANEVYVDKRLKIKQQQQHEQQMEKMVIEGEKLSFKDKMKLFARQSGELADSDNNSDSSKFKVSRKQREIESKFEVK